MKALENLETFLLRGLVFLLPLFFLPITGEFYDFNKLALLTVASLVVFVLWGVRQTSLRNLRIYTTPFDLPVLAFAAAVFISALLQTPNKMDAFILPGTASFILASTLFYFLVVQYAKGRGEHESLTGAFLAGGALAAVATVLSALQAFTLLGRFAPVPLWLSQPTFNTTGGILPSITLYLVLLPLAWSKVKGRVGGALAALLLLILLAGIGAAVWNALPGKPAQPRILPIGTGWSIALETLKREPLFGVGPGNFIEAFSRFRPVEYNQTNVWNVRFASSSNWYLHAFTVSGLLGLAAFLWILWTFWRHALQKRAGRALSAQETSLLVVLALFLLVPGNLLLLFAFYLLLAKVASGFADELSFQLMAGTAAVAGAQASSNVLPGFVTLVGLGLLASVLYFGGRAYGADMSYRQALNAIGRNDGTGAYNSLIAAINKNPQVDRYRVTYSQVNLALANSIATKEELTDQDRQTIAQLVQQSIKEAKAAVALNSTRSTNWVNLAQIYRSLMAFAQGADQWALASYQQAIALEPINPVIRVELGGVFYALGQYDDASQVFGIAVAAKPDFANAHYNLAIALREDGKLARALQEMSQALALADPETPGYEQAQQEFEELQRRAAEEAPPAEVTGTEGEQPPLQAPSPAPEPVIRPPLELPEEAAPPATEPAETTE